MHQANAIADKNVEIFTELAKTYAERTKAKGLPPEPDFNPWALQQANAMADTAVKKFSKLAKKYAKKSLHSKNQKKR